MNSLNFIIDKYKKYTKDKKRVKSIKAEFLNLFDSLDKRVIIYGAGAISLPNAIALLEACDIKIIAIVDSDEKKWGREVLGYEIISPETMSRMKDTCVPVLVSVRGEKGDHEKINIKLRQYGFNNIIQCDKWIRYREVLMLKDYNMMSDGKRQILLKNIDKLFWLYNSISENESRKNLQNILTFRLIPYDYSFKFINSSYFDDKIYKYLDKEIIIDCGAYRGDTLLEYINIKKDNFQEYHAFEMDPINLKELGKTVSSLPIEIQKKVVIHPVAIGEKNCTIRIQADGSVASHLNSFGNVEVNCTTLDEQFLNKEITLIKMDIEGAERIALKGAQKVIKNNRPVLVISAYHLDDDLWKLPKLILDIVDDYELILRREGFLEYLYYAIPKERFINNV